jgi:hypothetical protein
MPPKQCLSAPNAIDTLQEKTKLRFLFFKLVLPGTDSELALHSYWKSFVESL